MKKILLFAFMLFPVLAQAQSFKYQKTESGFKNYQGQATLTGTFSRNLDPEYLDYMGDDICFEPNQASSVLIPRPKGDERTVWFCFSNFDTAKKPLNYLTISKKGIASIKVKQPFKLKTTNYL